MDWQEYFQDGRQMVETINQRLEREKTLIRYVNLRYRLYGQAETKWLYDVTLQVQDENVVIATGDEQQLVLPLDEIEYIRLRPFYYAACVGFKEFSFYAHPETE